MDSLLALHSWVDKIPNVDSWCKQKNDVIQGAGELGKNGITEEQADSTGVPPDQKK